MAYKIGIDLGGTNIAGGIINDQYELIEKQSVKTEMARGFKGLCEDMANLCHQLIEGYPIELADVEGIGIGCPGMINEKTGEIIFSNNLSLYHEALQNQMEALLGRPVQVANDANTAALGEYMAGAGSKVSSMVMVTLGTGVGSGIILGGKIISGFNYSGGELGHMVIERKGRLCTCGRQGCLESYASATGLIQSAKEAMLDNTESSLWVLAEDDIDKVTGRLVFHANAQGDLTARQVVNDYIEVLAIGLANIVNALQPELIAIGGGISQQGEWLIQLLQEKVDQQVFGRYGDKQTSIKTASLGNDAGIIGAALLVGKANEEVGDDC